MDREAWCAVIHGIAKSWTRLSDWTDWAELNWGTTSWFIHSCLFAVSSHGKRDEGASWSLWQGHYSHSWGFHSCDQSLLKAHILILSHWGLGFRHIHWGGGHKHSVYSRQHPTHSSKAPEILSLEVNIPFFWMSLSFIFRGWLAPI